MRAGGEKNCSESAKDGLFSLWAFISPARPKLDVSRFLHVFRDLEYIGSCETSFSLSYNRRSGVSESSSLVGPLLTRSGTSAGRSLTLASSSN